MREDSPIGPVRAIDLAHRFEIAGVRHHGFVAGERVRRAQREHAMGSGRNRGDFGKRALKLDRDFDIGCTIAGDRSEEIVEQIADVQIGQPDALACRFARPGFVEHRDHHAHAGSQHRDRRSGIVDCGRQCPAGDFREHDQAEPRIMVELAMMIEGEGTADLAIACLVASIQPGDRAARADERAGHHLYVDDAVEARGDLVERGQIDMGDVARLVGKQCAAAVGRVGSRRHDAHGIAGSIDRAGRHLLDPVDRVADPPEVRQMLDPAQQSDDDDRDDQDRADEQDEAARFAIESGRERADADDREEEGADEGGKRVLRGRILDQQLGRARSDAVCGGREGRHHCSEREGRHRQHRRGKDAEDIVDRVRADLGADIVGDIGRDERGEQRETDRSQRKICRPEPDPAKQQADHPFPA
ncbi:hypothetical protein OKW87_10570 [Sphingomonas sp. M1-B02]|nr:hypothetical protein [Sphingomonas sp. S6-11]UZK64963.1 hypothetical protein OKW87_10570 [Sphingomonas sp. S6-11]